MSRTGGRWHRILVWTYDRGTIPYDIICALILAFIFLTPRSCFQLKILAPAIPVPAAAPVTGK